MVASLNRVSTQPSSTTTLGWNSGGAIAAAGEAEPAALPPPGEATQEALYSAALADRLMDDLFDDLERSFEGGDVALPSAAPPETVALQTAIVPSLKIPDSVLPPPKPQVPDPVAVEAIAEVKRLQRTARSLDRSLVIGGLVLLAGTVAAWLINRSLQPPPPLVVAPPPPSPAAADPGAPTADEAFAAYMQRSIAAIDRREVERSTLDRSLPPIPTTARLPGVVPVSPLPGSFPLPTAAPANAGSASLPLSGNVIDLLNRLAALLERGQLPPPPAAARPAAGAPAALRPAARPANPPPALGNEGPLANPTVSPSPMATSPQPESSPQPSASVAVVPAGPSYALVGLLELGDRSAALVAVDGVTRRVSVGEAIGASGWTLMEVANQQAKIRRNGEVRTLYVGQNF